MSAILLKNVRLYAPEPQDRADILIAGEKILRVAPRIAPFAGARILDGTGLTAAPGFIDQHVHVTGGGGAAGPASRAPEADASELLAGGITSVVGVLGTDGVTRSPENLLAKVRALKGKGLSAWMYTGSYAFPPVLLSGSVRKDLFLVPEVLGVKIALGDHRSSFPTVQEILRLLSDIRTGGMIAGKTGLLHVHLGALASGLDTVFEVLKSGIPLHHIRPTHCNRTGSVMEQALRFAKMGGRIDLTAGGTRDFSTPADAVVFALKNGVRLSQITLSSDGHGAKPAFDTAGKLIRYEFCGFDGNFGTVRALIAKGMAPEDALSLITSNPADALGLPDIGRVREGKNADIGLFNGDWQLRAVFARGKLLFGEVPQIGQGTGAPPDKA
jgi:beta-aspartyl-dipeptidase (metallo-type)